MLKKIFLIMFSIVLITGCSFDDETLKPENNQSVEEKQLIEYYKDDEMINLFINVFNELYPDETITSDMLTVYHHHGKDHKDQVQLYMQDLEITITGTKVLNKVEIFIDNIDGETNDIVKDLTMKFTKVFDTTLTEKQLLEYWNTHISSNAGTTEHGDIEYYSQKKLYTDKINIIEISGKLYKD